MPVVNILVKLSQQNSRDFQRSPIGQKIPLLYSMAYGLDAQKRKGLYLTRKVLYSKYIHKGWGNLRTRKALPWVYISRSSYICT